MDPSSPDLDSLLSRLERWAWTGMKRSLPVLLAIGMLYRFLGLGFGDLQPWDESLYALRMRIVQMGFWWDQSQMMPHGFYFAAHPPLYPWLATLSTMLGGMGLAMIRFPSALSGALLVLLLFVLVRRRFEPRLAAIAALALAFTAPVVFNSRQGQLDSLLSVAMLGTLLALLSASRGQDRRGILLAALCLGLALMTKMVVGLLVPFAVFVVAWTRSTPEALRLRRIVPWSVVVSLPLWVPWTLDFVLTHWSGDPWFLFSPGLPLGATLAGQEGTVKDTGMFYYLNQLVIHLSLLAPLALRGAVAAWKDEHDLTGRVVTGFTIIYLLAIWIPGSSFAVYLIPVLPALFTLVVQGYENVRIASNRVQLRVALAMMLCGAWSSSQNLREVTKGTLRSLFHLSLPDTNDMLVTAGWLVMIATIAGALVLLERRDRIHRVFSPMLLMGTVLLLALTTGFRIWVQDPRDYETGITTVVRELRNPNIATILVVGDGWNPQLTWYLNGEDQGWGKAPRHILRLEPTILGWNTVPQRIRSFRDPSTVIVVEQDRMMEWRRAGLDKALMRDWAMHAETPSYVIFAPLAAPHPSPRERSSSHRR